MTKEYASTEQFISEREMLEAGRMPDPIPPDTDGPPWKPVEGMSVGNGYAGELVCVLWERDDPGEDGLSQWLGV